jgi:hypothetical protein
MRPFLPFGSTSRSSGGAHLNHQSTKNMTTCGVMKAHHREGSNQCSIQFVTGWTVLTCNTLRRANLKPRRVSSNCRAKLCRKSSSTSFSSAWPFSTIAYLLTPCPTPGVKPPAASKRGQHTQQRIRPAGQLRVPPLWPRRLQRKPRPGLRPPGARA